MNRAYIEELEQRIERMQSQLESLSRPGNEQLNVETPRDSTSHSTEDRESEYPVQSVNVSGTGHEKDQSYVINAQDGRTRYFGWLIQLSESF